jgi:hypothetical protein
MAARVKVASIVDELGVAPDEARFYLDRETGEVVLLTEEMSSDLEGRLSDPPDWQLELMELAKKVDADPDRYVSLPDRFEVHEWDIMRRFVQTVDDDRAYEQLMDAIHGRGAFRHFKDTIHPLGIADDWYQFRDRAFEEIAIAWLEEHGIPYTRE